MSTLAGSKDIRAAIRLYLLGDAIEMPFLTASTTCRWDEWEVPIRQSHPLLPAVLAERHPFTWFDAEEATGPG